MLFLKGDDKGAGGEGFPMAGQALIGCTEGQEGSGLFAPQCHEAGPAPGEGPLRVQNSDGKSAGAYQRNAILPPKGEVHIDARPRISFGANPIGVQVETLLILAAFHENGRDPVFHNEV
jgi:hypothetical protein